MHEYNYSKTLYFHMPFILALFFTFSFHSSCIVHVIPKGFLTVNSRGILFYMGIKTVLLVYASLYMYISSFFGFGAGRRQCPGEVLARSRIFLLFAHILQKFDIDPVGELPDRDVRNYSMSIIIKPPAVTARFTPRNL